MGTIIEQLSVTAGGWRARHSALRVAVGAARACLGDAGCPPAQLDLLVNAGIYRDRNLGEPALAALIQEDIGANPEDPHPGAHGTFSFDVANGVCGPLTALSVVDGFLRSGSARRALVVASDADPGHGLSELFPFTGSGGAVLCGWVDGDAGLGPVRWLNQLDGGASFRATVSHHRGRNRLRFAAAADVDEIFAEAAGKVARECLEESRVDILGVDAVVAAPATAGFAAALARHLGLAPARVTVAHTPRAHSAALIAALHAAATGGRPRPGTATLLVAAGAGVTAGAALYRAPEAV